MFLNTYTLIKYCKLENFMCPSVCPFSLQNVVDETEACRYRVAGSGSDGAHLASMKDEEPRAQVQGCGARTWPGRSWHCDQLPAGWAAHPNLQRLHHFLLRLCHVVHQGRLRHRLRRHHLVPGVLRRVCGAVCDAAALQKSDLQHYQWSPIQRLCLPCPRLTSQGHVHWPCKYIRCTFCDATKKKEPEAPYADLPCLHLTINNNQIVLTLSTVWSCFFCFFFTRGQCQKETPQRNTLKAFNWNQGKWCTNVQSAAASSLTEHTTAGGAKDRRFSMLHNQWQNDLLTVEVLESCELLRLLLYFLTEALNVHHVTFCTISVLVVEGVHLKL